MQKKICIPHFCFFICIFVVFCVLLYLKKVCYTDSSETEKRKKS